MTAIIDALESRELVRRERHATDRRFITVHLTEAGTRLLEDATPARTAAIVELMSDLTARLARLCRRLLRTLDPAETERESERESEAEAADAEAATTDDNAATAVAASATASDSTQPST